MYILLNTLKKVLSAEKQQELTNNFNSASTDKCRINLMLRLLDEHQFLPFMYHKTKFKNRIDSEKFKNEGNKIFLSKRDAEEYLKALELYNKSIAFAPNNSKELALGFANRSAVLFHFQKYFEAVQDIDRALELNYPAHLKHKLLLRKTECLALLGSTELNKVYETTLQWLNEMSLNASSKETLKNKLTAIGKVTQTQTEDDFGEDVPEIVSQKEIPCATDAVALRYNKKFGRHLIATREIKPGEILAIEKVHALAIESKKMYTHCAHCLKFAWGGIPCEKCVFALYCSKNCKDRAWKEYHDIECSLTGDLLNLEMENTHFLSMRLLILAVKEFGSLEKLKEEINKIDSCKTDPRTKGFSKDGKFDSNSYKSVYSLVTNTEKRSFEQLFHMTYNSALIVIALAAYTKFFEEPIKQNLFATLFANEKFMFAGGLILRNLQILANNAHQYAEKRVTGFEDCGTSIMPFLSLINHDCNPNAERVLRKGYMLLYAVHPIKKDTQILDSYIATYKTATREDRQSTLAKHYFFSCKCTACERNWPVGSKLSSYNVNLIKSSVQKKRVEEAIEKLGDYHDSEVWAKKPSDRLKYIRSNPNTFEEVQNIISVLVRSLPVNSSQVVDAIGTLKQILDAFGNMFEVPELKISASTL